MQKFPSDKICLWGDRQRDFLYFTPVNIPDMINTCQGFRLEHIVHIHAEKKCLLSVFRRSLISRGLFPSLSRSSEFDRSWAKTNCPVASRRNSGIRRPLCYSSYCFICLESDRGLPGGTCRTSADTKRITEAARYTPRWWRHHHIAMQRERWIPGPQAPSSCFNYYNNAPRRHSWTTSSYNTTVSTHTSTSKDT